MAPRHEQGDKGRGQVRILECGCEQMPFHVMHPDQLAVSRVGERLCVHDADKQRSDQPGSLGHRHGIHRAPRHPRLGERAFHHRRQRAEVGATRQLRYDAAEHLVHVLRQDDEPRELGTPAIAHEDGRRGLVAGRFDAEDDVSHVPSSA